MCIPKYFQSNRKPFLYQLLFQLGFFTAGLVIVLIINRFFNEDMDYACMGTLMSLCGILAGNAIQISNVSFRLTVAMGQTRRYYLLWNLVTSTLLTLQGWLTAFCLYKLESGLYSVLYAGYTDEMPAMGRIFQLRFAALSIVLIGIIFLFFGALFIKFGAKGFWTLWIITCFSFMFLPQSVDRFQSGDTSLLAKLGGLVVAIAALLTPAMWVGVGGIALLAMLFFSIRVYLKAEIHL